MAVGSVLTVFWRDYWGKYRYVHPVIRKNVFIDGIILTATPKPLYAGDILCMSVSQVPTGSEATLPYLQQSRIQPNKKLPESARLAAKVW